MAINIMMHMIPAIVSQSCILDISFKIEVHISTNVEPCAVIPIKSLIWDDTIRIATAEVNPDDTGPDTKSMIIPDTVTKSSHI